MPKVFNVSETEWVQISETEFGQMSAPWPADYAWSISKRLSEQAGATQLDFYFMSLGKGQFSYPYHSHRSAEELFMVISGQATLRTPDGFQTVGPGDAIFTEMGESGAHQFYNAQEEPFVYLDIRVHTIPDVCDYPDSGKVAIYSPERIVFKKESEVGYFDGEESPRPFWPEDILAP